MFLAIFFIFMEPRVDTVIMLGKPGAGKGTQSGILKERMRFKVFSSGEKFRELAAKDSFLGRKIGNIVNNGGLMPYWFAGFIFQDVMINRLKENERIIFDGAARKRPEAELIHDVLAWFERPYLAVYIDIPDDIAVERLKERKQLIGRADDDDEHIKARLEAYYNEIIPAIDFFREKGTLLEIDGNLSMEQVSTQIINALLVKK
jgi:adenylate kinase